MTTKVEREDILTIKESLNLLMNKIDDPVLYLRRKHYAYSLPELKEALNISEDTWKKYIEEGVGEAEDRVFLKARNVGLGNKKKYMVKMVWVDEFFERLEMERREVTAQKTEVSGFESLRGEIFNDEKDGRD